MSHVSHHLGCGQIIKGSYLSALGAAWHPEHFACIECKQTITGTQYRKKDDKPFCDSCYSKVHGVKCANCNEIIQESDVFEALGKQYHVKCFVCAFDGHEMKEEAFHVHEEKIYCPLHFKKLFVKLCDGCGEALEGQFMKIGTQHLHAKCFKCTTCKTVLDPAKCDQVGRH